MSSQSGARRERETARSATWRLRCAPFPSCSRSQTRRAVSLRLVSNPRCWPHRPLFRGCSALFPSLSRHPFAGKMLPSQSGTHWETSNLLVTRLEYSAALHIQAAPGRRIERAERLYRRSLRHRPKSRESKGEDAPHAQCFPPSHPSPAVSYVLPSPSLPTAASSPPPMCPSSPDPTAAPLGRQDSARLRRPQTCRPVSRRLPSPPSILCQRPVR